MPFDPAYPPANAFIESAPLRNQFNGLKDLIDAVPGLTDVVIDSVTTLPPGNQATVTASMSGTVLHLTFGIPEGAQGSQGSSGSNGNDGPQGPQGPQGPPGEVTQTDLNNAVLGTLSQCSNISNSVNTLGQTADASYNPTQFQEVMNKVDELINTLRR